MLLKEIIDSFFQAILVPHLQVGTKRILNKIWGVLMKQKLRAKNGTKDLLLSMERFIPRKCIQYLDNKMVVNLLT